jgi:hypothetical protein
MTTAHSHGNIQYILFLNLDFKTFAIGNEAFLSCEIFIIFSSKWICCQGKWQKYDEINTSQAAAINLFATNKFDIQ